MPTATKVAQVSILLERNKIVLNHPIYTDKTKHQAIKRLQKQNLNLSLFRAGVPLHHPI